MLSPTCSRVRFGVFELNLKTRELSSGKQTIPLQEQPYRLLLLLLERGGEVATREEIQTALWDGDTIIDFERGINAAVKNLRRTLGDSPSQPHYIETLPRLGYRLVAPVDCIESSIPRVPPSQVNGNGASASGSKLPPAELMGQEISYLPLPAKRGDESPTPRTRPPIVLTAVAMAAISIGVYILVRMLTADPRPQSGRLDGATLIILNSKGQELWRKGFSDGFFPAYYPNGLAPRMWFGDLNGDGHTNVLLLYQSAVSPKSRSTVLICYSDRGKEVWRWVPGRALAELEGDPPTFYIGAFGVLKAPPGEHRRIVVSSSHKLWYPNQIALLDSNGKLVSEYWHSGHLDHLTLADLDGDGRQEIIAAGISNGYHQATLIVLDPDRLFGSSTEAARPEIQIHGIGVARERIRLLFHRSDLNMTLASYNEGDEVTVEHGDIRFSTLECRQSPWCHIWYEFDTNFRLLSAYADDTFRGIHNEFYHSDKHPHLFSAEEEREFQKVRCLVGCKTEFVPVLSH
jgi:DNA-binding winged helix-turn-helix (wHTH) protein